MNSDIKKYMNPNIQFFHKEDEHGIHIGILLEYSYKRQKNLLKEQRIKLVSSFSLEYSDGVLFKSFDLPSCYFRTRAEDEISSYFDIEKVIEKSGTIIGMYTLLSRKEYMYLDSIFNKEMSKYFTEVIFQKERSKQFPTLFILKEDNLSFNSRNLKSLNQMETDFLIFQMNQKQIEFPTQLIKVHTLFYSSFNFDKISNQEVKKLFSDVEKGELQLIKILMDSNWLFAVQFEDPKFYGQLKQVVDSYA